MTLMKDRQPPAWAVQTASSAGAMTAEVRRQRL